MLAVHVFIQVKPEYLDAFISATEDNARHSLQEPGIARFDLVRQADDPTRFVLVEVYIDEKAPARHKETAHYARWREEVAPMMAEPRSSLKYETLIPAAEAGWKCR